jgi:chromosome segregation ATPase
LNDSRNTILDLHKQVCELDQKLTDKEIAYYEATKTNNKLKQEVSNLEIKLSDKETKLRDAENKKVEAESRVAGLKKEKDDLLETLDMKDKELQNKINTIELEKIKALDVAKEAEETARIAKNEMQTAEIALRAIQKEMSDLEESLRNEYENQLTERVHEVEEESLKKISQIQSAAELEIKSLHNTLKQLQFEYSVNYVKKCELEEAVEEVERLKSEIESLEVRMEELKDEEQRAKDKLADCEEKINLLRNDLDNATLQYSEAVLDKTKIANEKALIEQELNRSVLREVDSKKRLDEVRIIPKALKEFQSVHFKVENELYELRQSHMKQLSSLQMHKSKLEVRVSELESSNAELHNRLIKIQAGCGDHVSSSSLPNTPNFVNQIVSFRRQHSENSGYTSEDHLLADDVRGSSRSFNRSNQNFDIERNEANSSPDLGIESDHGRFSSLETHLNVQRPLLQTLELTESMNNLLDAETNRTQEVDCGE